jgi:hypothetical protein
MVTSMLGGAAPVVFRRAQSRVGQPLPFHASRHLILYTVSCVLVTGKWPAGHFLAASGGSDFGLLRRPTTAMCAGGCAWVRSCRTPTAGAAPPPVTEHRGGLLDGGGDVAL